MKPNHLVLLYGLMAFTGLSPVITTHAQGKQAHPSAPLKSGTQNDAIKNPVVNLYQALNTLQKSSHETMEHKLAALTAVIENSYDLPVILNNTVGYRYGTFTPQEKDSLLKAFKAYTVARYYASFGKEQGTGFSILPEVKPAPVQGNQIVSTKIGDASDMSSATKINYLVQKTPQGWKIVDVLLNGNISQIAIQHSEFNDSLAKSGSQGLIDMLNKKTQTLSLKQ